MNQHSLDHWPLLTVCIEQVIKSVCCVSVVRDYVLFRKFNLQEVAKNDATPNQAPKTTPAASSDKTPAETDQAAQERPKTKSTSEEPTGPQTEATGNGRAEEGLTSVAPAKGTEWERDQETRGQGSGVRGWVRGDWGLEMMYCTGMGWVPQKCGWYWCDPPSSLYSTTMCVVRL